ncbi:MAG: hypothetical protein KatS3mg085_009 [Candidatus Dojkabacteria bacterium]|nr:MAG: hypothetical protein KatS3mg085_009 [Candidatus Dojkabacteria bacterium]
MKYGLRLDPNPGRKLEQEYKGKVYVRYPIETPELKIGDDFDTFLKKYAKPYVKPEDILGIASKVVSIGNKLIIHESEVKISWLARLIVKFVTKWPDDIGYSHPRKMQVAINMAGYPRTILAILIGSILKLFGKRGYFYIIMGNKINAIDGFNPVSKPPMNQYAVLPPKNGDELATQYEKMLNCKVVILDGNNVDNNVLGMGEKARADFNEKDIMIIAQGNPQGQEYDGRVTPFLIIREKQND